MQPVKLTMGVDSPNPTPREEDDRKKQLLVTVQHYLPEFAAQVDSFMGQDVTPVVVQHQDAFAAAYDLDEYTLLGMAVKYAGLRGCQVVINGTNHETF